MKPYNCLRANFRFVLQLIGTVVDIYLLGVLTAQVRSSAFLLQNRILTLFPDQFIQYWVWYRDDKLSLQLAVIGLHVLTFLKSIQCLYVFHSIAHLQSSYIIYCSVTTWIQCVNHMNRLADAMLLPRNAWWQTYNGLIVSPLSRMLTFISDSTVAGCTMQSIRTALLLLPTVDHLATSVVAYCSHHPAAVSKLRRDYLRGK